MKFVQEHLNRHHLFNAPHKWFLALLTSPVHAAQMHYKKNYHLTFAHAKKLFFFDMTLLLSVFFLIISSIGWMIYDPTVTDAIDLTILADKERIVSGEIVRYDVRYQNHADVTIEDIRLRMVFPIGFVHLEQSQEGTKDIEIGTLHPGEEGIVSFTAQFFDVPEQENSIRAVLEYRQKGSDRAEQRIARHFTTLRGSILSPTLLMPEEVVDAGEFDITLSLRNGGDGKDLEVTVPLGLPAGFVMKESYTDVGVSADGFWKLGKLGPGEQATVTMTVEGQGTSVQSQARFVFTPEVHAGDQLIPQQPVAKDIAVYHPRLHVESAWSTQVAVPGGSAMLQVIVRNPGDIAIEHVALDIELDRRVVDLVRAAELLGTLQGSVLHISDRHHAGFASLAPGDAIELTVEVPLRSIFSNVQEFAVFASAAGVVQGTPDVQVGAEHQSAHIALPTSVLLTAESRYYTAEGDQLGRGPLPPQVGQETKYWAIVRMQNTSAIAEHVRFSATLPPWVQWTGRTSVSMADNVQYDASTREVSWGIRQLPPQTTAGVFMELAVTPTGSHIGQTPALLTDLVVTATDSVTNQPISSQIVSIDASLPNDALGSGRGTAVRQ